MVRAVRRILSWARAPEAHFGHRRPEHGHSFFVQFAELPDLAMARVGVVADGRAAKSLGTSEYDGVVGKRVTVERPRPISCPWTDSRMRTSWADKDNQWRPVFAFNFAPTMSGLWPPAAATIKDRLASSWPRTSEKSTS